MQSLKTPNVYRFEKDVSEVTAPAGTSVGALVMTARQGVVNQRVLVTNDKQLVDLFGTPIPDGLDVGIYAGMEFLKESDSLYVVRATSGTGEKYACVSSSATAVTASNGAGITAYSTTELLALHADGNTPIDNYDVDDDLPASSKITIACSGPGTYGNNIGIVLLTSASPVASGTDWMNKYDASISGTVYKLSVYVKETGQTVFPTSPEEVFYGSSNYQKDGEGKQLFIESVVNGKSKYIYVNAANSTDVPAEIRTAAYLPVALAGGADSNATTFTATQGQVEKGWDLFLDKTKVNVNILIDCLKVPATTPKAGVVACTRLDCIASLQIGTDVSGTATQIIASTFPTVTLQSYAAVYAGWDMIYDSFNDRNVYIPKNVFGAVIMARTDRVANTWDAPAGQNRGILPSIGQGVIFSDTDIGNLYEQNINTSRFIRGVGNVLWGQKTAQKKKSALDRINVRRLLLFIENSVEPSLLPFLFEPNTSKTQLRVFGIIDSFMKTVQAGGGVTKYEVVCDDTNNTTQTIDNNELIVDVYVQPTKTIEFIRLNVIVTRTGVNFQEIR